MRILREAASLSDIHGKSTINNVTRIFFLWLHSDHVLAPHGLPRARGCMSQMRRILQVAVAFCIVLMIPSIQASPYLVQDHFDSFNKSTWYRATYCNEATCVSSKNAYVASGSLVMKIPAKRYGGAEVETKQNFGSGEFKFSMKASPSPHIMNAIFLYDPSTKNEIDLEVINEGTWEVWFTTYVNGIEQSHSEMALSFDPSSAYHSYTIKWSPGNSLVQFFVDEVLFEEVVYGANSANLYLVLMAYAPSWTAKMPTTATFCYVDYVVVSA